MIRELGRGGMGVVYLARNTLMDRLEVLKVLNRALTQTPGMVERFLREIRAAAQLSHPNIVTAYSALQVQGLFVFAMEYVEGEDLARLVRELGPLPVSHACECASQTAKGLQHAFERRMIHRDIKPHNLIATRVPTPDGGKVVVKVLDFGLAKASHDEPRDDSLTDAGQMLGTPHYMAPEQALDAQKADIRADIYSLGCTLFFLLTGNPPYPRGSTLQIVHAHGSDPVPSVRDTRPDVPVELERIVRRLMAKRPADRFATPAEVIHALNPFRSARFSAKPALSDAGRTALSGAGRSSVGGATHQETTPITTFASSDWLRDGESDREPPGPDHRWLRNGSVALAAAAVVVLLVVLGPWGGTDGVRRDPAPAPPAQDTRPDPRLEPTATPEPVLAPTAPDPPSAPEPEPTPVPTPTPEPEPPRPSVKARTNSLDMRMVLVGTGRFVMGSNPDELDKLRKLFSTAPRDAFPQEVSTETAIDRPFLISDREVTVGQFRAFADDAGYVTDAEKSGGSHAYDGKRYRLDPSRTWRKPGFEQADDHPVVCVSQNDARDFAQWLSRKEGRSYRLPTEPEWEYAARAGSRGLFGESDDPESLATVANVADASYRKQNPSAACLESDDGFVHTAPVGSYPANAWGLRDMLGNVAEWCVAVSGENQPYRGGSWLQPPRQCRPAARTWAPAGRRLNYLGFRLVDADVAIDP